MHMLQGGGGLLDQNENPPRGGSPIFQGFDQLYLHCKKHKKGMYSQVNRAWAEVI